MPSFLPASATRSPAFCRSPPAVCCASFCSAGFEGCPLDGSEAEGSELGGFDDRELCSGGAPGGVLLGGLELGSLGALGGLGGLGGVGLGGVGIDGGAAVGGVGMLVGGGELWLLQPATSSSVPASKMEPFNVINGPLFMSVSVAEST